MSVNVSFPEDMSEDYLTYDANAEKIFWIYENKMLSAVSTKNTDTNIVRLVIRLKSGLVDVWESQSGSEYTKKGTHAIEEFKMRESYDN